MQQQVPTWVAVVVIVVLLVIVGVGYWFFSGRQATVQPPEQFQPGKTAQFVPQPQGGQMPGPGKTMPPMTPR